MPKPINGPEATASPERRRFLHRAGGAICAGLGIMAAFPAPASLLLAPARRLRFVHTHTGESLTAEYFDGSDYSESCLTSIDHLLRDFRNGESHRIDPRLLDILYELQNLADRDSTFEVISGYRSPATNAMLHRLSTGVAEHSQHVLGKAIDIRLTGYPTRRLGDYARSLARGGVGYYASSDFIHVDTGSVRFW
jgi:uncharacterized protein YcbK (DUF882 family)